jgi:lipopolysaccharide export system permease protein
VNETGEKTLQLFRGRRYEGAPGTPEIRIVEFDRYELVLSQSERGLESSKAARSLTTLQLFEEPTPANLSELLWRASIPVMCLLQMLIATSLSAGAAFLHVHDAL